MGKLDSRAILNLNSNSLYTEVVKMHAFGFVLPANAEPAKEFHAIAKLSDFVIKA